jgi:murein DD-endopeptidase MepM/ murein hydrolase activator NlpD
MVWNHKKPIFFQLTIMLILTLSSAAHSTRDFVPERLQPHVDVICGIKALQIAFARLDKSPAPETEALYDFMQQKGLIYDFGTGVEELAYTAWVFGYRGSFAFYHWTLAQLFAEVAENKPVLIVLGVNEPHHPGHFMTVTAVSPDYSRVYVTDPVLGRRVFSTDVFKRLWQLQENAGVTVRLEEGAQLLAVPVPRPDIRRKGIGGAIMLDPGAGGVSGSSMPPPPTDPRLKSASPKKPPQSKTAISRHRNRGGVKLDPGEVSSSGTSMPLPPPDPTLKWAPASAACGLNVFSASIDLGTHASLSERHASVVAYSDCSRPDEFIDVKVSPSDSTITLKPSYFRLAPESFDIINISARFPKHIGKFKRKIALNWTASGGRSGQKDVTITGIVEDFNLSVQPEVIDIGQLPPGKGFTTGLTVTNQSDRLLTVWLSSNDSWIKSFFPQEFTLSRDQNQGQEGVLCFFTVPQDPGPFTGTISVQSDAGHQKEVTIRGEVSGLELKADKVTGLTAVLVWNNPSNMYGKINKYIIYHQDKTDKNKLGSLFYIIGPEFLVFPASKLSWGTTYTFFVEAVDDKDEVLFRSDKITVTTKNRPRRSLFDTLPIYGSVRNWVIASGYFEDNGIDFSAPVATPCRAVGDGKIIFAGNSQNKNVGNIVKIKLNQPISFDGYTVEHVFYSHLSKILANNGSVNEGDVIGLSGVGNNDPHLHFGIYTGQPNIYQVTGTEQVYNWQKCYSRDQVYEMLNLRFGQQIIAYEDEGCGFADVTADHWACEYLKKLLFNGHLEGDSTNYYPETIVTRKGFVLADWQLSWVPQLYFDGNPTDCFDDNGDLHCPDRPLTRAEAAVYWITVLKGEGYSPPEPETETAPFLFDDVPLAESWYANWVYQARREGIIGTCEDPANLRDGRFRPNDATTRAEMACMMYNALTAKGILP